MIQLRLRTFKVTQEAFDRLPLLLSRSEFREWSGLTERDIQVLVRLGKIKQWRPKKGNYAKYYKSDLARVCGMSL